MKVGWVGGTNGFNPLAINHLFEFTDTRSVLWREVFAWDSVV